MTNDPFFYFSFLKSFVVQLSHLNGGIMDCLGEQSEPRNMEDLAHAIVCDKLELWNATVSLIHNPGSGFRLIYFLRIFLNAECRWWSFSLISFTSIANDRIPYHQWSNSICCNNQSGLFTVSFEWWWWMDRANLQRARFISRQNSVSIDICILSGVYLNRDQDICILFVHKSA